MTITSAAELARQLAAQLDEYIAGARTMRQVGQIEGALNRANALRGSLSWFEDLEEAAALVAPGEGPEFMDHDDFALVVVKARQEVADIFGV